MVHVLLSTDHLVTVVFLCQNSHAGLNHSTTETKNKVKGRLYTKQTILLILILMIS